MNAEALLAPVLRSDSTWMCDMPVHTQRLIHLGHSAALLRDNIQPLNAGQAVKAATAISFGSALKARDTPVPPLEHVSCLGVGGRKRRWQLCYSAPP